MNYEDLPFDEPLNPRFHKKLDLINREFYVTIQNYYDGRIKMVPESKVSNDLKHREVLKLGKKTLIPPIWRQLDKAEAEKLWKVKIYKDYYEYMGMWGQHYYETHLMRLVANPSNLPIEHLDMLPPGLRARFKQLEREKISMEDGLSQMEKYAKKDIRRSDKGKWYVGRITMGKCKIMGDYLMKLTKEARKQRDIDFEVIKNADLYRQEALKAKARQMALAELGVDEHEIEVTPGPPKRRKKKKKVAVNV